MIWKREDENMLKSKKRVRGESKKIRVADSTVKLIDKELQSKLKIKLPLDENAVDILAEYFEAAPAAGACGMMCTPNERWRPATPPIISKPHPPQACAV